MSFIEFESGTAKERARQDIREARAELLKQAEQRYKHRQEQSIDKKLRGEDDWMLPAVSRKIELQSSESTSSKSKKSKKEKKSKKSKKEKKAKRRKRRSSDSDEDSDASCKDERKSKRKARSSSSSESDEWVESKPREASPKEKSSVEGAVQRDDWMSGFLVPTFNNKKETDPKKDARKDIDSYDPKLSLRELNPFWKNGGTGLPTFKKPAADSDEDSDGGGRRNSKHKPVSKSSRGQESWRKKRDDDSRRQSRSPERRRRRSPTPEWGRKAPTQRDDSSSRSCSPEPEREPEKEPVKPRMHDFMTDQQMNEIGAKIIKAEIMGDAVLLASLKNKLETARNYRDTHKHELLAAKTSTAAKSEKEPEDVLLTATNSQGYSKPLQRKAPPAASDPWGKRGGKSSSKKVKVETHAAGERVRYFADDDKYNLKDMFENEKFTSANDQDEQFMNIASKHKNPNDDLEDIFAEKVRKGLNDSELDHRDQARAIRQHHEVTKALDSCDKCMDSPKMEKQLMVAMGTNVYLALPWHEGLQSGHCLIVPMQHVACSTNLDEDVWREIVDFQKAITKMFRSRGMDVIFFETARYLHKRPHLAIQCVPNRNFELAPFYFKKAIQESEREWSTNKQLVTLREKNLRHSIPKGLPYFWVQFGTDSGFAHVIEEQDRFPSNFAQEIIGGLLNLDARAWRKPRKEHNPIVKVKQFADWWKPFDITDM